MSGFRAAADRVYHVAAIRPVLLPKLHVAAGLPARGCGVIGSWDAVVVEVTLDDGTKGLGEVDSGLLALAVVPRIIGELRPHLEELEFTDLRPIAERLRKPAASWPWGGITSATIAAVETACLDAVRRALDVPT